MYFTWPQKRPGWSLSWDGMGDFSYHLLVFTGSPLPAGKSASCSHPQKPSVLPAGPTNPLPCARARPCRCGHPHLHQSTMSPLLLRTRQSPQCSAACLGPPSAPEYPVRPAEAKRPPSPTRLLPTPPSVSVVPQLPPSHAEKLLLWWTCGEEVWSNLFQDTEESFLALCLLSGWSRDEECPGPVLQGFSPGVGFKVLLCSVEGAILNFIFITFFVDELEFCNLHLEC